jgi:hypothetical protein
MRCRHCSSELSHVFLDLGSAPPSNAYLSNKSLHEPELTYPLRLFVCEKCWLVQTEDYAKASELFSSDYAYFSSISKSWLAHAKEFSRMISNRLHLNNKSFVVEIASNDGYLLKNFVNANIPCLGIEPTDSTAEIAEKLGIPVLRSFFGVETASRLAASGQFADLICGNNVYAHVPDINDFTAGLKICLKQGGTITLEFPHLLKLVSENQFDTVYHEHYSYLSLLAVKRIFDQAGLKIFDVEELNTHGGSLRIYGCHKEDDRTIGKNVDIVLHKEISLGLNSLEVYRTFQAKANKVKNDLLVFLIEQNRQGKKVAGYGAAAKGNTLMNYAGIKSDLVEFVCDAAPSKQGKFLPGSRIPIVDPSILAEKKPDWVVIFPWNIAEEVVDQQNNVFGWGGRFVVAVPKVRVIE